MTKEQYLWFVTLRERLMAVLLHLNSSNFGITLSSLHEVIKSYDNYLRDLKPPPEPPPRLIHREFPRRKRKRGKR